MNDERKAKKQLISELAELRHRIADLEELEAAHLRAEAQAAAAQEALQEREARLLKAQRVARMGFLDWDLKTNLIYLSDEIYRIFGLEKQTELTTPDLISQVVHPDDMEMVQKNLGQALQDIQDYNIDHRIMRPDGEVLWVHAHAEMKRDEEGNPKTMLCTVVDITDRMQAEQALRESTERLRTLREIDRAILQARSPEAIAEAALSHFRGLVPCQRASLAEIDLGSQEALVLAVHLNGETRLEAGQRLPLEAFGLTEDLLPGETHLVADLQSWTEKTATHQALLKEGIRSLVNVPLMAQGELLGVLNLGAEEPAAFTEAHIEVARAVADQLAVAIRQARLYEASQRKSKDLATLLKVSQALTSTLEMETVLQIIVESATQLIELDTGALYRVLGNELYLGAATPPIPPQFPDEFRWASLGDHPHIHQSVSTGRPVILPDMAAAELSPAERTILESRQMRSLLYVPLLIGTRPVGVLILGTQKETRSFSQTEVDLYRTLSNQAAVIVENARLFGEIQRVAEELEQRVDERTRELSKSNDELRRFAMLAADREIRIKELREENEKLRARVTDT